MLKERYNNADDGKCESTILRTSASWYNNILSFPECPDATAS